MWEMTFVDEKVGEYLPDGEILYDDNYQNTHHEVKTGWIKLYQIQGFFFFFLADRDRSLYIHEKFLSVSCSS